jgi:hypothetical protein
MQRVAESDGLEKGGEIVEVVGSFAEDSQEEIDFAGTE